MEAGDARRTMSLDQPAAGDDSGRLRRSASASAIRTPASSWSTSGRRSRRRPGALSDLEREVLRLRFVEDLTQSKIAEQVGYSQMHVSRILRRALDRLREASAADGVHGLSASSRPAA